MPTMGTRGRVNHGALGFCILVEVVLVLLAMIQTDVFNPHCTRPQARRFQERNERETLSYL